MLTRGDIFAPHAYPTLSHYRHLEVPWWKC